MDRSFSVADDSGDKKYFTMTPNFILNHSTANDQALYLQMKRFAGESGLCFASENTFQKKMGIGRKALKKSMKYLLSHGWVSFAGYKTVITKGGKQKIKTYTIRDIWKMNVEFYENKGVPESEPLNKRGVQKDTQGVSERASKKNQENKNQEDATSVAVDSKLTVSFLGMFRVVNPSYERFFGNKTQRAAMERLIKTFGVEELQKIIEILPQLVVRPYYPRITTPLELERDMGKLRIAYEQDKNKVEKNKSKIVFI